MNYLCYLIKRLSLFPACVICSPFVALSIFIVLSNLCRIIKLLSSWGFELFFLGICISLVISQDIPSCETFSRGITPYSAKAFHSRKKFNNSFSIYKINTPASFLDLELLASQNVFDKILLQV